MDTTMCVWERSEAPSSLPVSPLSSAPNFTRRIWNDQPMGMKCLVDPTPFMRNSQSKRSVNPISALMTQSEESELSEFSRHSAGAKQSYLVKTLWFRGAKVLTRTVVQRYWARLQFSYSFLFPLRQLFYPFLQDLLYQINSRSISFFPFV